jgi:predicted MFS family arabinose efflux permease
VLLSATGLAAVYLIDALSFLAVVASCMLMAPIPPAPGVRRPGVGSMLEGFRYVRRRQQIGGAYLIDINAMVFGMPRALFPALAVSVFHGGTSTLGLLYAAPGVGALLGAVATGWVSGLRRRGWGVTVAVGVWGLAIAAFGLVHVLWAALILLAVAGWADVISAVLRNTIIQTSVSDEFRSRLSSFQMAVVQGGPRLGDFEAGGVASAFSPEISIVSGGLACVLGAAVLVAVLPGFRHHRTLPERAPSPPPA